MKLYTIYTPGHQVFFDSWFLPSIQDDFELVVHKGEQKCSSGSYMSQGWVEQMADKVELILRAIKENEGQIFVYADVDIQFFGPVIPVLSELIKDKDMVIQRDSPAGILCAGFFAARGNEKNLKLWQKIREELKKGDKDDQTLLNILLTSKNYITWSFLPEQFFSPGQLLNKDWVKGMKMEGWKPDMQMDIPKDILMHHANWVAGNQSKIMQLQQVKKMVLTDSQI